MNGREQDKQHAFDAFCKRVLKNECVNAYLELERLGQREVNFSEMTAMEERQLQSIDEGSVWTNKEQSDATTSGQIGAVDKVAFPPEIW